MQLQRCGVLLMVGGYARSPSAAYQAENLEGRRRRSRRRCLRRCCWLSALAGERLIIPVCARDEAAGMERGGWWGVCVRACRGVGGGVIHALEVLLLVNSWVGAWGKGSWNWMLCPVRSLQSLRDRTQNPCVPNPPGPCGSGTKRCGPGTKPLGPGGPKTPLTASCAHYWSHNTVSRSSSAG